MLLLQPCNCFKKYYNRLCSQISNTLHPKKYLVSYGYYIFSHMTPLKAQHYLNFSQGSFFPILVIRYTIWILPTDGNNEEYFIRAVLNEDLPPPPMFVQIGKRKCAFVKQQSKGFGAKQPGFKSWIYHLLIVWPCLVTKPH